jgi:hypothetical protein
MKAYVVLPLVASVFFAMPLGSVWLATHTDITIEEFLMLLWVVMVALAFAVGIVIERSKVPIVRDRK